MRTIVGTQSQTGRFLGNGGRKFINPPSQEAWQAATAFCDVHDLPVVYRHHWPTSDQRYWPGPEQWGQHVASQILADLDQYPIWPRNLYSVGYNEIAVHNGDEAHLYGRFIIALAQALAVRGVKLLAFSFSVGHPPLEVWPALYTAMRVVKELGGGIDLHEYYLQEEGPGHPLDWTWTFARHRRVWESLPADLKHILIHIGETGLDREGNGYNDGFRARIGPQVYSEHLLWIGRALIESRKMGINILDASIFICGNDGAWPSFELSGEGQDLLEAAINQANAEAEEGEPVVTVEARVEPANPTYGSEAEVIIKVLLNGEPKEGAVATAIVRFTETVAKGPDEALATNTKADGIAHLAFTVTAWELLPVGTVVPVDVSGTAYDGANPVTVEIRISFTIGEKEMPEDQIKAWLIDIWRRQGAEPNTNTDPFFAYVLTVAKTQGRVIVPMPSKDGHYLNYSNPIYILAYTIPTLWALKSGGPIMEGFPKV